MMFMPDRMAAKLYVTLLTTPGHVMFHTDHPNRPMFNAAPHPTPTRPPYRCRSAQRTMFQPAPLTVASVFKTFRDIAK